MDVRASVPTDQIDKETAKPLTGDKFDRTKFDTLAADGFVSKEAALGVAPEILATVWGGERIALKASSAEDAFVEFGEYAPKPPDASTMVIPATNLTGVLGLLQCLKRQDTVKVVSGGARKRMRASSFSCGSKNMGGWHTQTNIRFSRGRGGSGSKSGKHIYHVEDEASHDDIEASAAEYAKQGSNQRASNIRGADGTTQIADCSTGGHTRPDLPCDEPAP